MKKIYFLLIVFILWTIHLQANTTPQNILILHSYHQSYKWTDDINRGIYNIFDLNSSTMKFYIEYMDSKRFVDGSHYENLFLLYQKKYNKIKFDVIICSDNNAFDFVKLYHKSLFYEAPVVFLGVNYFTKDDISGFSNFTGVNEEANIKANYELIKKLHPKIKNIYTIVDTTTTGQRIQQEVQNIILSSNDNINYELISDVTLKELKEKVINLPPNSAILLSVFFRSKDNQYFEYNTISNLISHISTVPMYGLWDFYLENGIIGGFLTSGFYQGKEAAIMAQQILAGVPISSINIRYESPNNYMFDYTYLSRHNIELSKLPTKSHIINKPLNLYEKYKKEIISIILLFSLMIVVIILLLMLLRNKELSKRQIKKELRFQQTLIDTVDAPIYYKNKNGDYIGCNKAFEKFLSLSSDDIIGKKVFDLVAKDLATLYTKKDNELFKNPHPQQYEGIHRFPDGSSKHLIFYKNIYYDEENNIQGIVGTIFDITKLKSITKKLNDLNKNLEKKVQKRTQELEESNDELEQTIINLENMQKRLVETEVVNGLGNIVAGVAHEINTPVGIGITASTHLEQLISTIHELYNTNHLSEEEFSNFLTKSQELSTLIHTNFNKTATLVKNFKKISIEHLKEDKRTIFMKEYMEDIITSIQAITKYPNTITINVECDKNLEVLLYTGAYSQIITNLILNSIHHGFEESQAGNININISLNNNQLKIIFKDNGKGIKQENIKKIFDPFFTTQRIKGQTGLGLNVIYNIITAKFNGSINCDSDEAKGVTFTIILNI